MKKSLTALLLPVLMSGSCTVGPDFKVPLFNAGEKWKQKQSATPTSPTALPDTWWQLYKDDELNRLVDLAFKNNNDLAAAKARVDTARALAGVDRAKLFPELNLNAAAVAAGVELPPRAANHLHPRVHVEWNRRLFGRIAAATTPNRG